MKGTKHVRTTSVTRRSVETQAYDSLNFWNDNESKVNLTIDALPISAIGVIVYTVSRLELETCEIILAAVLPSLLDRGSMACFMLEI